LLPLPITPTKQPIGTSNKYIEFVGLPHFRAIDLQNIHPELQHLDDEYSLLMALISYFESLEKKDPEHCLARILIGHQQWGSFDFSGTEINLNLSGISAIPTDILGDSFDYVALGHIHRPQKICNSPIIQYSGSPFHLRFGEKGARSITMIEVDETDNSLCTSKISVPVFRDLIRLEIDESYSFDHLTINNPDLEAYLEVILKVSQISPEKMTNLIKEINDYPQCKIISFRTHIDKEQETTEENMSFCHFNDVEELFHAFYKYKYRGEPPPEDVVSELNELIEDLKNLEEDNISEKELFNLNFSGGEYENHLS